MHGDLCDGNRNPLVGGDHTIIKRGIPMNSARFIIQSSSILYYALILFFWMGSAGLDIPISAATDDTGLSPREILLPELDIPGMPVTNGANVEEPVETGEPIGPGENPMEMVRVFVNFKAYPGEKEKKLVHLAGGKIRHAYRFQSTVSAEVPRAAIGHLKGLASVEDVEFVPEVYVTDTELDNSWGVKRIGAGTVHATNKGTGIRVAVIDTGIDYTHPDLSGQVKGGWDFVNNDSDPMDDYGHGTHVSGIIAAKDDDVGVVGVAPNANLYALKTINSTGSGFIDDVVEALEWCMNNGIQAVNMSFGGMTGSPFLETACDKAYQAGIVLVASAGNGGKTDGTGDTVCYPAKYDSVIAVAATDSSDIRAGFSSTGSAIEIAAPGDCIYSTYPFGVVYANRSGTSMAAPHVTGTVALMLAAGIPASNVRSVLQNTADDLGTPGRDPWYGYGLVDADEAVLAANPVPDNPPVVTISSPATGSQFVVGTSIFFTGSALDDKDGDISSKLAWNSNLQGALGNGSAISVALNEGSHTITAQVTDSGGHAVSQSITVIVKPLPDNPPVVTISSPVTGSQFVVGTAISFTGIAQDDKDGDISFKLAWKTNLQGSLGNGSTISVILNEGTHTITAQVTDSGGNTVNQSITVTVNPKPIQITVSVITDKSSYVDRQTVRVTHVIIGGNGVPVSGASVNSVMTTANGKKISKTGTTDASGRFSYTYRTFIRKDGAGTYKVDSAGSKTGLLPGAGSTAFSVVR